MSEKGEPHGYNFNVTNFNVILKHNLTEPWIQQTSFITDVLWDTQGTVTTKVDCTSIYISATTMAEHMPQNWMANQQFYILVV